MGIVWIVMMSEPVFIAVSKPLLTEFGIHLRLESCVTWTVCKGWHPLECICRASPPSNSLSRSQSSPCTEHHGQVLLTIFYILYMYSLVPFRGHDSINQHISFIWPCAFYNMRGVTINWINTQFRSNSRGTFDKTNLVPIACTFAGVSFNWIVTFSMET